MEAKKIMRACYFGYRYPDGGQCKYKCPPEANPKVLRAQARQRKLNDRRPTQIALTDEEKKRASNAVAKLDPVYSKQRGIAFGAAIKSHKAGARR